MLTELLVFSRINYALSVWGPPLNQSQIQSSSTVIAEQKHSYQKWLCFRTSSAIKMVIFVRSDKHLCHVSLPDSHYPPASLSAYQNFKISAITCTSWNIQPLQDISSCNAKRKPKLSRILVDILRLITNMMFGFTWGYLETMSH